MSLKFNDTTARKGLVQKYEREVGFDYGDVSGDNDLLKDFAVDASIAMDDFKEIALKASGIWQDDDSNHTDFPEIYVDIESGQRDYSFVNDGSGNKILELFTPYIKQSATATEYVPLVQADMQTDTSPNSFNDGLNLTGVPTKYDLTGNTITFDLIPDYDCEDGLKLFITREDSYFVYTDTTKYPGVPGIFHSWFYLHPAESYASIHTLESHKNIKDKLHELKDSIRAYYGKRNKVERGGLRGRQQHFM